MPEPVDLSDLMQDAPKSRNEGDFTSLMDKTFGKGKWRETGGFRTPQREDQLRAQGAQTVAPGRTSKHSLGDPEAPGARDVVVDGLTPQQVAAKLRGTGAKFRSLYPEGRSGTQGAHLHINTDLDPDPVDLSDLMKPTKTVPVGPDRVKGAPQRVTNDQVRDLLGLPPKPKTDQEKMVDEGNSSIVGRLGKHVIDTTVEDVKGAAHKVAEDVRGDIKRSTDSLRKPQSPADRFKADPLGIGGIARQAGELFDLAGVPLSVVGGPVDALAVKPYGNLATHFPRPAGMTEEQARALGEQHMATALGGMGPEAGLARTTASAEAAARLKAARAPKPATPAVSPNALRNLTRAEQAQVVKAPDPEHAAAVTRLRKEGVELTPGQQKGGQWKRFEESQKSSPLVGGAVRDAEQGALRSLNRVGYNRALQQIGESYPKNGPVGRDGVAYVEKKLGDAYDKVLPKVSVKADHALLDDLDALYTRAKEMPEAQRGQLHAILKNRVFDRMTGKPGAMDGATFKQVESELTHLASSYKGAPDPAHRQLGYAIDDALGSLRDTMERTSDPGIRDELKRLNRGWAVFKRIQDASARRAGSQGVFTAGDLLQSVKKGDRSVSKGAFARGDALLQDLADDAGRVMPNVVPDSGTTERQNFTRGRGVIGAVVGSALGGPVGAGVGALAENAAGAVTNRLASNALRAAAKRSPVSAPRNYLKAVDQRVLAAPAAVQGVQGRVQ